MNLVRYTRLLHIDRCVVRWCSGQRMLPVTHTQTLLMSSYPSSRMRFAFLRTVLLNKWTFSHLLLQLRACCTRAACMLACVMMSFGVCAGNNSNAARRTSSSCPSQRSARGCRPNNNYTHCCSQSSCAGGTNAVFAFVLGFCARKLCVCEILGWRDYIVCSVLWFFCCSFLLACTIIVRCRYRYIENITYTQHKSLNS